MLVVAFYYWWSHSNEEPLAGNIEPHNEVIMYSLTTCGYCKAKAREMEAAGIDYQEYYMDRDAGRKKELNVKMRRAGFPPRNWGTPILDVKGTILPGNPSLARIQKYL